MQFFFFKQKTAYEMRISDWSSDVCSSDLSGTTFAINLVAYSWALPRLKAGDVILLTRMEHHANIVPWRLVAQRTGARIEVVELLPDGSLDLDMLRAKMTTDVKLLAVTHVSNVLGTVNPVREIRQIGSAPVRTPVTKY